MTISSVTIRKILIVEDDPLMQAEAARAAEVFYEAEAHCVFTKSEADRLMARQFFDLAIVDLGLPDGSGISLIRSLLAKWPKLIVVVRTVFDDDEQLFGALAAGATGYLLKGQTQQILHEQLIAAANGEPVISPQIARKVLAFFRGNSNFLISDISENNATVVTSQQSSASLVRTRSPIAIPLTPRESEVLALIGKGLTVFEVANQLHLSENTIKTHLKSTYSKLNIRSRAGAALEAQRLGLLDQMATLP